MKFAIIGDYDSNRQSHRATAESIQKIAAFFNLITPEAQVWPMVRAGGTFFAGVCGLDGHSQAPKDGFMASREKGSFSHEQLTED